MRRGDILVTGQGMTDQYGIGGVAIELAIGAIADLEPVQLATGFKPQALIRRKAHDAAAAFIDI